MISAGQHDEPMTFSIPHCWCGNADLAPFSPDYLKCHVCETLVVARMPSSDISRVTDDEHDLYGRQYWFSHQENDLNFPNLTARAAADLPERCVHWLRYALKYKLPPAEVLELGSAHGGFVAQLRQAGFNATGLELSPWVVDFARRTFNVPMLLGPVEAQEIKPQSLDLIALMDVLEHLPEPTVTMRHCLHLLKPNGVLLIQTPCLPEGVTYEEMVARQDPFLSPMQPEEHLYLFSRRSISELFQRLKAPHLEFEPAIFSDYDMFLAVGGAPLAAHSSEVIEKALCRAAEGRMIKALLDLDDQFKALQRHYAESEADREARLEVIHVQGQQLGRLQAEWNDLHRDLAELCQELDTLPTRQAERRAKSKGRYQLTQLAAECPPDGSVLEEMSPERAAIAATHQPGFPITSEQGVDRPSKLELKAPSGRLVEDEGEEGILCRTTVSSELPRLTENGHRELTLPAELKRIAIDLTPILPGGENGGVKPLALELIQQLGRHEPDREWILLTSSQSHDELAFLDAHNVRRLCVMGPLAASEVEPHQLLKQIDANLLFCPFTAPSFFDPAVPTVSLVLDLQYAYYPEFFQPEDRRQRDENFQNACRFATKLICISDYVRGTVLEKSGIDPQRVTTIHIRLFNRIEKIAPSEAEALLRSWELKANRFLLYPANFWEHKNHRMLVTAFGIYRQRHPESKLKLVCTGALSGGLAALADDLKRMGLEKHVLLPGYLDEAEFAALMQGCRAVIFPSLYEGFGMPVLEAMAAGKPVLCSNVTSLPEISGEAALLFDPRKPVEMAEAIERLESDQELAALLVRKGQQRLVEFGGTEEMVRQYLQAFKDAWQSGMSFSEAMHGRYQDGWIGKRVLVTYPDDSAPRYLEIGLEVPPWVPFERVTLELNQAGRSQAEAYSISRGKSSVVRYELDPRGGFVNLSAHPTFQPKAQGATSADDRWLSCVCASCKLVSSRGVIDILAAK